MSGVVDVGDAFELAFTTAPGSTVVVSWFDNNDATVLDHVAVPENPPASGKFPRVFVATAAGLWKALFAASGNATSVEKYYVRAAAVTGPPPLATVGEVGAQFGAMTAAQEGLANTLLRAASKLVRQQHPRVDVLVADGRLDAEVVGLAVTNMVLRVLRNPQGLRGKTVGPFSETYDTTVAAGLLVLSDNEVGMLTPRRTGIAGTVGTIMTRPGLAPWPRGVHSGW